MSPGDTCVSQQGSREVDRKSYDEVLDSQQLFGVIVAAVGCILILVVVGAILMGVWEWVNSRRTKRWAPTVTVGPMVVIVIGALLLVAGPVLVGFNVEPALDPVICDGEEMERDDFCTATGRDYSEQQGEQKLAPISLLGSGIVVVLIGLGAVAMGRRKRRTGRWS